MVPGRGGDAGTHHLEVISQDLLDSFFNYFFFFKYWGFFGSGSGMLGEELISRLIQSSCYCSRNRHALGNSSWLAG